MIPKFRAWDVHEEKMFTNDQLIIWNGNVYANDNSELNVNNLKGWSIDEKYLMQSTGLKDKNGKEIYDGDIVLIYGEKISKVFYSQGSFCVDILNGGTPLHGFSPKQLEVIGNVWENPELMEEE